MDEAEVLAAEGAQVVMELAGGAPNPHAMIGVNEAPNRHRNAKNTRTTSRPARRSI